MKKYFQAKDLWLYCLIMEWFLIEVYFYWIILLINDSSFHRQHLSLMEKFFFEIMKCKHLKSFFRFESFSSFEKVLLRILRNWYNLWKIQFKSVLLLFLGKLKLGFRYCIVPFFLWWPIWSQNTTSKFCLKSWFFK